MDNLKKNKMLYICICCFVVLACIVVCYFIDKNSKSESYNYVQISDFNKVENINNNTTSDSKEKNIIYVHIAGEVVSPGVFCMNEGDRIKDVIEKAGGLTDKADIDKVNLAYELSDGQKISIPNINDKKDDEGNYITEDNGENVIMNNEDTKNNKKVNINTATQAELETLTGIGPSIATKIIEYRKNNGKFKNIEEIKNVSGVGEAKYKKIQDEIMIK